MAEQWVRIIGAAACGQQAGGECVQGEEAQVWQSIGCVSLVLQPACGQQAGDERLQGEEALVWQSSGCVSLVLQPARGLSVGNKRVRIIGAAACGQQADESLQPGGRL